MQNQYEEIFYPQSKFPYMWNPIENSVLTENSLNNKYDPNFVGLQEPETWIFVVTDRFFVLMGIAVYGMHLCFF